MSLRETSYAALARKYRQLAAWQRDHAHGRGAAPGPALRAMATEFPGALRALARVPLEVLEARADALDAVVEGTRPPAPWMDWIHGYHSLMAVALWLKRRTARSVAVSSTEAVALAREATVRAGMAVDEDFVHAVARPPGGRLNPLVFARLGAQVGEDPRSVWDTLFPTHRAQRLPAGLCSAAPTAAPPPDDARRIG